MMSGSKDPIKERFKRWYHSGTRLAQLARNAYRRSYFALFGYERVFYVYDDRKLVYIEVPKAGCTSIKATIGRYYGSRKMGGGLKESSHLRVERGALPQSLQGYFKFSFVRNPFSRLVSCYLDKIYRFRQSGDVYAASAFRRLPTDISFSNFVYEISKIPDYWADHHFKSQYAILYRRGRLLADWVGRLENIDRDWEELASRFDLIRGIEFHKSTQDLGPYEDYRSYYTQELIELVYQRYRQDFEVFGYPYAYRELSDFIRCQQGGG